jgi:hypothetical protein
MVNLTLAIKWYLKNLFPPPVYMPVLSLITIMQLYIIEHLKSTIEFSILTQMLLIPLIILIAGSHFFRGKLLTIFELSLIGSWGRIAISKIIVFTIGFLPFIVLEIFVLWIGKSNDLIIHVPVSLLIYASLSSLFADFFPG